MNRLLEEIVAYEMGIDIEILREMKRTNIENYINLLKEN